MKCENCEIEHSGDYGSGRFCCSKCARGFSTKSKREEITRKSREKLLRYYDSIVHNYVCEKCDSSFERNRVIKKGRKIHCDRCRRNVKHVLDSPIFLTDLSKRTVAKIIKRAKIKCMMCGWDRTSLDIHHIIHKKNKGTDDNYNLICLCPNCHRLAHENKYDLFELLDNSIDKLFSNWKDYYHPSN